MEYCLTRKSRRHTQNDQTDRLVSEPAHPASEGRYSDSSSKRPLDERGRMITIIPMTAALELRLSSRKRCARDSNRLAKQGNVADYLMRRERSRLPEEELRDDAYGTAG